MDTKRLALDPGNTSGGLEFAGILGRLREPSYRGSQTAAVVLMPARGFSGRLAGT